MHSSTDQAEKEINQIIQMAGFKEAYNHYVLFPLCFTSQYRNLPNFLVQTYPVSLLYHIPLNENVKQNRHFIIYIDKYETMNFLFQYLKIQIFQ